MKPTPLIVLSLTFLCSTVKATTDVVVELVTIPLYHAWEDAPVRYVKIPYVGWDLKPVMCSYFYMRPYGKIEGRDADPTAKDMNLISVYKIKVEGTYDKERKGMVVFNVDSSESVKPNGYRFTIAEVSQMAAESIALDYPDRELVVINIDSKQARVKQNKSAQKGGAHQPATAPKSKGEGSKESKSESDARAQ